MEAIVRSDYISVNQVRPLVVDSVKRKIMFNIQKHSLPSSHSLVVFTNAGGEIEIQTIVRK